MVRVVSLEDEENLPQSRDLSKFLYTYVRDARTRILVSHSVRGEDARAWITHLCVQELGKAERLR